MEEITISTLLPSFRMSVDKANITLYNMSTNGNQRMKTHTTQIGIRISNDLLEKIKIMAGQEDRSVTNMIIHLLKSQLRDREK